MKGTQETPNLTSDPELVGIFDILKIDGQDITFAGLFFGLLYLTYRFTKWWWKHNQDTQSKIVNSLRRRVNELEIKLEEKQTLYEEALKEKAEIIDKAAKEKIDLLERLNKDEDKLIEALAAVAGNK